MAALLEHGAQIDSRSDEGNCAIYRASQLNHIEVVALLLEHGAQVDLPTKTEVTALSTSPAIATWLS